tara:strand:+ start:7360 stop:8346 length:987 start_codon:yes stop_codon:yes gene_type:complete
VANDLTPKQKLMDTNNNGKVSKKERLAFNEGAGQEVATSFGMAYALLTSLENSEDPEAQAFFQFFNEQTQEYRNNPDGFSEDAAAILMASQPWMKKYIAVAIKDMEFEAQNPDLWLESINSDVELARDLAVKTGAVMSEDQLREFATNSRRSAWNEAELKNAMAEYVNAENGVFSGAAGEFQSTIADWSRTNGLGLSDDAVNNYVKRIAAGDITENDVKQQLRNQYMVGTYPAWAEQIKAGQDPSDIASPYKQQMANLLEVDPETLDLNDNLLQMGLQGVNADGRPGVVPMYEFKKMIRKDDRWDKTENALAEYTSAGSSILKMFGLR